MNTTVFTSTITAAVGALAEALLSRLLDRMQREFSPPADVRIWLRSRGARLALEQALLQALAETGAHVDLDELPFFDERFLQQGNVALLLLELLLPGGQPANAVNGLAAAWRELFPGADTDQLPVEEAAQILVVRFRQALRIYPPFRAMMDSNTLADLAECFSQLQAQTDASLEQIRQDLAQLREQIGALALLHSPQPVQNSSLVEDGRPSPLWTVKVPGERSPLAVHLGFLCQEPLVLSGHHGVDIYVGTRAGEIFHYQVAEAEPVLKGRRPLPAERFLPEALARWREFLVVAPQPLSPLDAAPELLLFHTQQERPPELLPVGGPRLGPPAVVDDWAYTVAGDGTFYAVDLARREVAWSLPHAGRMADYPPLVVGRWAVLPAREPLLTCVDLQERRVVWRHTPPSQPRATPAFCLSTPVEAQGIVYFITADGGLHALELTSGEPVWPTPYYAEKEADRSPVLAGDIILFASRDHRIHAVDRRNASLRWVSHDLGRRILSRPVVVGETLFVGALRRHLHALNLVDGTPLWPEPVELPDRVRGDLVVVGDKLIIPTRKGLLVGLQLALPAAFKAPRTLLKEGRWAEAAAALVSAEQWEEAARIYLEHGLVYPAARLFQRAGLLEQAAALYSQDTDFPIALRRAAELYRQIGELERAAQLLQAAEDWAAAAYAWEEIGQLERAAKLYADHLGEPRRAARLYQEAGLVEQASELYEELGEYRQAWKLLESTGDPGYASRIQGLMKKLVKQGEPEPLEQLLEGAETAAERARIYETAGEWTSAAEAWLEAGEWERAGDGLAEHGYIEQAIALLRDQPIRAAQARAAHLLEEQRRWQEALELHQKLADQEGQARCYKALGELSRAARLYEQVACQLETRHPSPEERARVADYFAVAARLYKELDRQRYLECRRKVHYYRRWPWLAPGIKTQKRFVLNDPNTLEVTLINKGAGVARNVELYLYNHEGWIQVTGLRLIPGIGPGVQEQQTVQLTATRAGEITVRVALRWVNPSGEAKEVELWEPWVITVIDPGRKSDITPPNVTVYGNFYQGETIVHGNLYRDQAYHQEGDRVEIRRQIFPIPASESLCPNCGHPNPVGARFCEQCGYDLEKDSPENDRASNG